MPEIYLKQLPVGPMANFAYLLGAAAAGECAVVDPGWDAARIQAAAKSDGRRISAVILTHGHFDHAGALRDLFRQGSLPVFAHRGDAAGLAGLGDLRLTSDGDAAAVGGLEVRFLHTPGHTPGSQCVLVSGQLFTGDTLFLDCCGRTDLDGSDREAMHRSLRLLAALPPGTVIWPGHDYGDRPSAALAEVLRMNPFLAARSLAEFRRLGG